MPPSITLTDAAGRVLGAPAPADKVRLTLEFAAAWREGHITELGATPPPERPARPARPELRRPGDMPRRTKGGLKGRQALVHAIAHIELNAIDLAWDAVARFAAPLPRAFCDDWVAVAEDEARHFHMLDARLGELGLAYGDLPAHDGLWETARDTADDVLARMALAPMLLEARGLDTSPAAAARLAANGDAATAQVMARIAEEEISHVAAGVRWFEHVCRERGLEPVAAFRALVAARFKGVLKPPFNDDARARAGMSSAYYASHSLPDHPAGGNTANP